MNPDVPLDWGRWNDYHFKIRVSETPEGWVYGYDWANSRGGGGVGCWLKNRDVYSSRSKAIVACAERMKEIYGNDKGSGKAIAALDRIISEELARKPHLRQYTIFDYL